MQTRVLRKFLTIDETNEVPGTEYSSLTHANREHGRARTDSFVAGRASVKGSHSCRLCKQKSECQRVTLVSAVQAEEQVSRVILVLLVQAEERVPGSYRSPPGNPLTKECEKNTHTHTAMTGLASTSFASKTWHPGPEACKRSLQGVQKGHSRRFAGDHNATTACSRPHHKKTDATLQPHNDTHSTTPQRHARGDQLTRHATLHTSWCSKPSPSANLSLVHQHGCRRQRCQHYWGWH
eukprot:1136501-Pelagomonas_calceolata.AAC.3